MYIRAQKFLMRKKGLRYRNRRRCGPGCRTRCYVLRVHHREDFFKYDDLKGGDIYVTNEVPHFITIPTTAGTGSEVGRSAIISDDETHQKKILFSPKLLARIVFADPLLTMDLPTFYYGGNGHGCTHP